jgi:hypothetical protein
MTLIPRNAADAVISSLPEQEAAAPKKKNIIKKLGEKLSQRREARYYKDDEE